MSKAAVVVMADTDTHENMGRMLNALELVKEYKESNGDATLIFDGAGAKWIPELEKEDHKLHNHYNAVKENVVGVCSFCANAFGVKNAVERTGHKLLDEYDGHPSLKQYLDNGYNVVTF